MGLLKYWAPTALAAFLGAVSCAHRPPMTVQAMPVSCHQVIPAGTPAVTWITPDDPRDIDRHARWCRTVGPVLVAPLERTPMTAPVADHLVIVSWNVHVGGGDIEGFVERLRGGEFTDGVPIAQFALLLQEVHRQGREVPVNLPADAPVPHAIIEHAPDGTRRDIKAVAERMGLHLFYAPAMRNGAIAPEDRGTAILSTLPLSDLQAIELPFERQRRVALAATVEGATPSGAAWQLRLADVQIDTSLALTRGGPFAARKRQAEALVEALTMGGPDATLPTVVGGDFNTWLGPKEPALDVMRRAFADVPDASSHGPLIFSSTWRGPLGMRAALDYVFLRGVPRTEAPRRLSERFGSDHYPLLTVVGFTPASVAQRFRFEPVE